MNAWLETGTLVVLIICSVALALRLPKFPRWARISAQLLAGAGVALLILLRFFSGLETAPLFSMLATSQAHGLILAVIFPILISGVNAHLPRRREKVFQGILGGMCLLVFVLLPSVLAATIHDSLARIKTVIDPDGICLQQTAYTCGPAAAVTALRKMGLPAEEGQIAIWSRTTSFGTKNADLADALRTHYASNGVAVHFATFTHASDLQGHGIVLAVMKYDQFADHIVAILHVTPQSVVIGDPMNGKVTLTTAEFENRWRACGLCLGK